VLASCICVYCDDAAVDRSNGETMVVNVRIWNETVSNLTLMALGSSAPEIMLSIIEVVGNNFNAGDLGPGTIVGSAAFNLFVIIGLCVSVIPDGEVRRIKHLRVFFITASWSIFAYLWLYIIIAVTSPDRVDLWEAILTFVFFPTTVLTAYIADRYIFLYSFLSRRYRGRIAGTTMTTEGRDALELGEKDSRPSVDGGLAAGAVEAQDAGVKEFEKYVVVHFCRLTVMRVRHVISPTYIQS